MGVIVKVLWKKKRVKIKVEEGELWGDLVRRAFKVAGWGTAGFFHIQDVYRHTWFEMNHKVPLVSRTIRLTVWR